MRNAPIGGHVVDFVCYEKGMFVEVDGGQHSVGKDGDRERWPEGQGFKVLRFWNNDVLNNIQEYGK
ncbi:MAG: DUF559 domain-containing protein [Planctomycetia bacterium]|nr:DUF559 domain-containing protein [Planctomycetia bacterium]